MNSLVLSLYPTFQKFHLLIKTPNSSKSSFPAFVQGPVSKDDSKNKNKITASA